jgi:2-polyprenyl-3-methyl-5-hydroxy-6-metoxy-1,4-benzoquinol methylase
MITLLAIIKSFILSSPLDFFKFITNMKHKIEFSKMPPEYDKLAKYFDIGETKKTKIENIFIEKILKRNFVKSVLDFTCGTGSQTIHLHKKGYKVTGCDISQPLLEIARRKSQNSIQFIHGDMRKTKISSHHNPEDMDSIHNNKFDAVISIWNAIGHLSKKDFNKTLKNINAHLNLEGIYVFDIFNASAINETNVHSVQNLHMVIDKKIDDELFCLVQYSKVEKNNMLASYNYHTIQAQNEKPNLMKSKFKLQMYSLSELNDMLSENGFYMLNHYDFSKVGKIKNINTTKSKNSLSNFSNFSEYEKHAQFELTFH